MSYYGFTITATHDSTPRVLNPDNNGLVFTDESAPDRLYLRRVLAQPLILGGADFDWLFAIEQGSDRCDKIEVTFVKGAYTWTGEFDMSAVEFDIEECKATVTVGADDTIECFLNLVYDDEFNILEETPVDLKLYEGDLEYSINTFTGIVDTSFRPPPLVDATDPAWTLLSIVAAWSGSGYDGDATWVRQTITTNCVSGSPSPPVTPGWALRENNCGIDGTALYTKGVSVISDPSIIPVEDGEFWQFGFVVPFASVNNLTISGGRLLNNVIVNSLSGSCPADVRSEFLGINPEGDAPSNTAYDVAPFYQNLLIFQNSDITRPNATEDATIGRITLKRILEFLRDGLRLFWFYDEDGKFRIEHESYRTTVNGVDLETYQQARPRKQYRRISDDSPRLQRFSWLSKTGDADFDGVDIIYENSCGNGTEQINAQVLTDIGSVLVKPELTSETGFALVAAGESGGNYFCISAPGPISGTEKLNAYLSWAFLHENLHTFERPFATGNVNGSAFTFDGVRPQRRQELTVFMCPDDYLSADWNERAQSYFGWGRVDRVSYNFATQELTVTLLH